MDTPDDTSMQHGSGARWRLDKHIPVALLVALAMQTAAAVWWSATVNANLNAMEQRVSKLETNTALTMAQGNQLAAVDAKMSATQDSIKELKSLVMSIMVARPLPLREQH